MSSVAGLRSRSSTASEAAAQGGLSLALGVAGIISLLVCRRRWVRRAQEGKRLFHCRMPTIAPRVGGEAGG